MPQITVHYTENLPSADDSYKTRRFTVELTQEAVDTADINGITERMFAVAKSNVQAQVERAKGDMALREMNGLNGTNHTPAPVHPVPPPATNSNTTQIRLASQKQITFLLQLAKKSNLTHDEILSLPKTYNQSRFEDLSAQEASALIDRFTSKKAA